VPLNFPMQLGVLCFSVHSTCEDVKKLGEGGGFCSESEKLHGKHFFVPFTSIIPFVFYFFSLFMCTHLSFLFSFVSMSFWRGLFTKVTNECWCIFKTSKCIYISINFYVLVSPCSLPNNNTNAVNFENGIKNHKIISEIHFGLK
jgi:hypothetical protein